MRPNIKTGFKIGAAVAGGVLLASQPAFATTDLASTVTANFNTGGVQDVLYTIAGSLIAVGATMFGIRRVIGLISR